MNITLCVYPLSLYLVFIPLKHYTQHSPVYTIDYQNHLMQIHKNVPAVMGIYPNFANRKVKMLAVLWFRSIRLTCPCNEAPLTPHFYTVKLGFTEVFIFSSPEPKAHR